MWKLLPPCILFIRYQLPILNLWILIYFYNELLYSYIYTSEKRKQQTRFSMRKKIKIRILRISCRHSMNNILAFGHYWRAESLVGFTTTSKMIILLSRWQRIQTIAKIRIRIFRIGCWHAMNNILAFGPYWRAESLVGTTISQMMILLSRWRRIQTSKNGCDFDTLTAFMAWQLCFFCILHIQALQSNTSFYVSHQEVHPRFS